MSDVLPPPPPPRGDNSCWKWGGITCAVGCGGVILLCVVLALVFGPTCKKFFNTAMQAGYDSQQAAKEMRVVWTGLERYQRAHNGKYPDTLKALIPEYLPNEQALRFSKRPEGPPFTYYKPAPDAPGSSTVLEYAVPLTIANTTQNIMIRIHKDGTIESNGNKNFGSS